MYVLNDLGTPDRTSDKAGRRGHGKGTESMAKKSFRDFLRNLEDAGEISRIKKIVDPREMSGLAAQNDKATIFEAIEGYPGWKTATALLSSRRRLAITLDCDED